MPTTIAIVRNVCRRAVGALLLLTLWRAPELEAQMRATSALSLHGSAPQAVVAQRVDSTTPAVRHYSNMPEESSSRAPLIGALIGGAVMTAFAADECSRLGCMSPLPLLLAAGAGAIVGASVGWIVKRLRAPLPAGDPRGLMNRPDDQLGEHPSLRALRAAPRPISHLTSQPAPPAT